jgi:hypothetical protein
MHNGYIRPRAGVARGRPHRHGARLAGPVCAQKMGASSLQNKAMSVAWLLRKRLVLERHVFKFVWGLF